MILKFSLLYLKGWSETRQVALVALCAGVLLLSGCEDCSETAFKRLTAPDRSRTAIIVERECGVTVGFVRKVVVCDGACNAGGDGDLIADTEGLGISNVSWENRKTLVVLYDTADTKFFVQKQRLGSLRIKYVALPSTATRKSNKTSKDTIIDRK